MSLVRVARHLEQRIRARLVPKSFSLNQLDWKLDIYLGIRNGFFVEVGANDGIRQSNTLYFEKYRGWTGLLIEAIPELAEKCRANRPGCIVENCALVAADYPQDTVEMTYCDLMSFVRGTMDDPEEQAHLHSGQQHLKADDNIRHVTAPAKTLSEVLDKHRVDHVDLLSLDVEGYEAHVLRGLDFDRHMPEFLLIEVRCQSEIEAVLDHRYEPIAALTINSAYSDILYRKRPSR